MEKWFFSYGISTAPELMMAEVPEVSAAVPAKIPNHKLYFANYNDEWKAGTSCIVPSKGDTVLGTAYRVSQRSMDYLIEHGLGYHFETKTAEFDQGFNQQVEVLLPPKIEAFEPPADSYVGRIRYGLSRYRPIEQVDEYLTTALGRPNLFRQPMIQRAADAAFKDEYNCAFRRLYPWQGVARTPWGSAIGVVAPGTATTPHSHDEEETAIILGGSGELTIAGEKTTLSKGDVVFFPPFSEHTVRNTSASDDLEVLFIWWGGKDSTATPEVVARE